MSVELRERAMTLAAAVREHAKELDKGRKALEMLADGETWADRSKRERAEKGLRAAAASLAPDLDAFCRAFGDAVESFRADRRRRFVDDLVAAIDRAGLAWREIGQQPPRFDVAGIQVAIDWDREEAELSYAREPLAKVCLDPGVVLETRTARLGRLEAAWHGAEAFFDACASAYRARCARAGKAAGDRVRLVDLVYELRVEYELRGHPGAAAFGRAELAYGLDRLARAGALECRGRRLELGTATGGAARVKKQVLFLEAGMGGGQYYLTLRVVAAGGRGA